MASISGLSSGLDTAGIIDKLMTIEAAPQTRLKTRLSTEQSQVTVLQTLNTKVATLASKATALTTSKAWTSLTATSSAAGVSVTAGTGAQPGGLTATVTSVARPHQVGFTQAVALDAVVTSGTTGASTTVRLDRYDGSPVTLETGDGTLAGLVAAINDPAAATGLRATAVRVGDDSYQLLVVAQASGAASDFQLTAADGATLLGGSTVVAGTDAVLDLGAGITARSTDGVFTELMPGVSLTVADSVTAGTVATIGLTRDAGTVSAAVKDLVEALNGVLTSIDTQSGYDATTKTAGALSGDAGVRSLRSALLQSIYDDDGRSLADVGIQVTRQGTLSFDATVFAQAWAADPAGTAARFTGTGTQDDVGLAGRVAAVARSASDSTAGTLTATLAGRRQGITRLQTDVASWDGRLELKRATLERQFTALETALNQMQSQSSWLAGQISSLSSS